MMTLRPDVARRLMTEMKKLQKAELGGITVDMNSDNFWAQAPNPTWFSLGGLDDF